MERTRIVVEIEIEIDGPQPGSALAPVLQGLAARLSRAEKPLESEGVAVAQDGHLKWRVRSWKEAALTTCTSCGRRVPKAETDVREQGDVCQPCSVNGAIAAHWEQAVENTYERGRRDGYSVATLIDALVDD